MKSKAFTVVPSTQLEMKQALESCLDSDQLHTLSTSIESLTAGDINALMALSAKTRRLVGDATPFICEAFRSFSQSELARVYIYSHALMSTSAEETIKIVNDIYRYGDNLEKAALIKGLFHLDVTGAALELAITATRTNDADLFSAIALSNPYPYCYFDDLHWQQLVLKTLHLKLPITDVHGIKNRLSKSLSAKTMLYLEELALAGREYPAAIWAAIRFGDIESAYLSYFLSALVSPNYQERLYSCQILQGETLPAQITDVLQEQVAVETDTTTRAMQMAVLRAHI